MGYSLPGEGELKDAPEGIRAVTLQQGVNPAGGPIAGLRLGLFNVLGYTLGAEGNRDSPPAEWRPRAALHLRIVTKTRAPAINLDEVARVVAHAWADIEDETMDRDPDAEPDMRDDLSSRAVFRRKLGQCEKLLRVSRCEELQERPNDATKNPVPNVRPLHALSGPATRMDELVEEEGRERVEQALGLGMPVFVADGEYLAQRPVFDLLVDGRIEPALVLGEEALARQK
jgi:hypothetical protein